MAFVLDVAGYGARGIAHQQDVQRRLQRLVEATLDECGLKLDPEVVEHQWTGDGINAVLPADIDPTVILPLLIRSLASALGADNARSADRIRLRMAVSAGLIERSVAGFSGQLIVDISRLVDSSALREALTEAPAADLAVAISDHVYAMVDPARLPGHPRRAVQPGERGGEGILGRRLAVAVGPAVERARVSAADRGRPGARGRVPDLRAARRRRGRAAGVPRPDAIRAGERARPAEWAAVKVFDQSLSADARCPATAGDGGAGRQRARRPAPGAGHRVRRRRPSARGR